VTPAPVALERRLLNYARAAAYLGISLRAVKELAADGKIPKTPIGHRVLFDREDLDAFIERAKRSA
jgi:excisionase family DNA binding protein